MTLPQNAAEIKNAYELDPYGVPTQALLEKHVLSQVSDGTYDFDANKALAKIYQYVPENANPDIISHVLVLSMMRLPSTDFLTISYLVPGFFNSNPKVQLIQKCSDLLETGKFADFWTALRESPLAESTFSAISFQKQVRRFIVTCISNTYVNIEKALFLTMLNLKIDELVEYCSGCSDVDKIVDDTIILQAKSEGQNSAARFDESTRFEEILRLVDSIRT